MVKPIWDYKTIDIQAEMSSAEELTEWLKPYGKDGWELVQILLTPDGVFAIFKKQLPPEK